MPQWTRSKFESIAKEWQQQRVDNESNLEIARFQLASLQGDDTDWWQSVRTGFSEFVVGRGLTLAIAVAAALSIWLLMRSLFWVYQKKLVAPSGRNSIHIRLASYAYRILIWLLMLLAVVMTFYLAGDFLLLTLVIILLVAMALSFRHILPLYLAESKLLLDIGPVRLGEKVVYEGLPMQVKSINVDSLLRNPDLKGIIRLPLRTLGSMVSRPVIDEPWFPCNAKDYILFSDGRYGQVLEQTLELVQVRMMGSVVHFPTADFFRMDFRNLSHMGFNVAVTFGVDYQHQTLCLDVIPERIHKALAHAFTKAGFNDQTLNLQVDFKEAGASSLDYLIIASFKGEVADSYFSLGRLIQKTCVAVCNEENWIIPFAQFTVHQGEGFQALNECHVPSSNAGSD
tara:strand:+ start:977 stop:2170 length:1194 start_codon:yes stop_codon:yes gene_type:complete